jgi:hypothetical protein
LVLDGFTGRFWYPWADFLAGSQAFFTKPGGFLTGFAEKCVVLLVVESLVE